MAEITDAGGEAVFMAGDVKGEDVARRLVDRAEEQFGRLDVAFNNAGSTGTWGAVADVTLEGWHETLDTNLTSGFLLAKH